MEFLIKAAQLILSLSLLVVIHEFGHFIFARMFGVRVEKFYLFFDTKFALFRKKIGETEYGIGWIPFGGYVKLAGMVDESMDTEGLKEPPKDYEFRSKPAWQRLLIMIGGVLMNIITAFIIYIGIVFSQGETYIRNDDVKYGYAFTELGREIGFENGDRIISVDGKSYDNPDIIRQEVIISNPKEVVVIRDGRQVAITMNEENIGGLLKDHLFNLRTTFVADSIVVDGNAYRAGMIKGDSLVALNGVPMRFQDEFSKNFEQNKGGTVEIAVARDSMGVEIVKVLPVEVSEDGKIGISYNPYRDLTLTHIDYNFWQAIGRGSKQTVYMVGNYIDQLALIVKPKTEAYKQLGSVITMGSIFSAQWDWLRFWHLTALFSVILAVMNLLPIPALDGGHVVFTLYEMITRRKPSEKFLIVMQWIGMIIIFALIFFALGNDIIKLFK